VPERGQPAAGPQHLRRLGRTRDRVDPVPCLPGDDRVEVPAGGVPGFERRRLDLDAAAPCEVSHPRVGLDAQYPAAGRLELPGCYAGAATDVKDVGSGAFGNDPVHHGPGIGGPGTVVAFDVRAERLRHLSVLMRLASGQRPSLRRYGGHASTVVDAAERADGLVRVGRGGGGRPRHRP
jgi:hypothetical protein